MSQMMSKAIFGIVFYLLVGLCWSGIFDLRSKRFNKWYENLIVVLAWPVILVVMALVAITLLLISAAEFLFGGGEK